MAIVERPTTSEALELREYSNLPKGTALSEQRMANGRPDPFAVKIWCLGNEMDGPWQIGHKNAQEYGRLAADTARGMAGPGVSSWIGHRIGETTSSGVVL